MAELKTLHYFEYYPHYSGDIKKASITLDVGIIDGWYARSDEGELTEEDADALDAFEDQYALSEVIYKWPAVKESLIKQNGWSDDWEEGTHSISPISMEQAKRLTLTQELKNVSAELESEIME